MTLDYIAVASNPSHSQGNAEEAYNCDLEELIASTPQTNGHSVLEIKQESPSTFHSLERNASVVAEGSKLEYQELESENGQVLQSIGGWIQH